MLRNLVRLAIVLLIAHGLYRFLPPYMHYHGFKDAVKELALFSRGTADADLVDRVLEQAAKYQIPIDRDAVRVTRDSYVTRISVNYDEQIEWVPSYKRPMSFSVSAEGWHATPPARPGAEVK
jgi:hypothetical protein